MLTKVPPAADGFFAGIQPHRFTFEYEGRRHQFELPQRYYDWSLMLAHFPASEAAVRRLLPADSGLEPVTIAPGIAVVSLGAFEYRKSESLRPYNEVGVMFPVRYRPALPLPAVPLFRPEWFSDLGFYIWQLPVTTGQSRDAGRALWNFPKTVGDIRFIERNGRRRCVWSTDRQHVLTLEVRMSSTTRQLRNFNGYSILGGRLQQTLVQTYGEYDESRFGLDASFSLGDHEISEWIRELGTVDAAIGRLYCSRAESILPGPSPVPFTNVPAALQASRILKSIVVRSAARPRPRRVAICGGGVAGMSAAHELAERGFEVAVFEKGDIPGGKARSVGVPGTAGGSRRDLPGEHGFRFFPGFYKHLPDTMARIPYGLDSTVVENLVPTTRVVIDFVGGKHLVYPARFPLSLEDLSGLLLNVGLLQERTGCGADEIAFYIERIWQLLTSCEERRLEEYEQISWWDYIRADRCSPNYQWHLANTTRVLVAADPKTSSTRTVGNILLQMLFDLSTPGVSVDRVLNGPTNEAWIEPWLSHLRALGVRYHLGAPVQEIKVSAGRITGVVVDGREERADYYVAAVPVEAMARFVRGNPALVAAEPRLVDVEKLAKDTEWMAGIQFYFKEPLPLESGHQMLLDSEWALTSLSQAQFWKDDLATHYGDGTVRDILSVDISDWNTPGRKGKPARRCTREEIVRDVWDQLTRSLPFLGELQPAYVFLDPDIVARADGTVDNREPLLVNKVGRWRLRPEAATAIPNLFLASDYVRTYTDLATMEGANEAARRAVNAILDVSRSPAPPCQIWNLHEPLALAPWRFIDRYRYYRGMPWHADFPLVVRGLELLLTLSSSVTTTVERIVAPDRTATAETAVAGPIQDAIGDVLQAFIDALQRGDTDALRPLFAPRAIITVGIEDVKLDALLRYAERRPQVRIRAFKTIYERVGRVHLRMTIWLSEVGAVPERSHVEGHVHAVFVPAAEYGRDGEASAGGRWLIASLRCRRAGEPARLEHLPNFSELNRPVRAPQAAQREAEGRGTARRRHARTPRD